MEAERRTAAATSGVSRVESSVFGPPVEAIALACAPGAGSGAGAGSGGRAADGARHFARAREVEGRGGRGGGEEALLLGEGRREVAHHAQVDPVLG